MIITVVSLGQDPSSYQEQPAYDEFIKNNGYKTQKRKKIDFNEIVNHLKNKEISCRKYNYSLDKRVQNSDHYYATL